MDAISKQPPMFFKLLMAAVLLSALGGLMLSSSEAVTEQETVRLEILESGRKPKSRWIKVSGHLLWDWTVEERSRKSGIGSVYVPLVSDRWEPGDKVAAFVEISTLADDGFGDEVTIEGMTGTAAMSGPVRSLFKRELGIEAAEAHIVINEGTSPQSEARAGRVCIGIGVSMLAICGVMLVFSTAGTANGEIKEGLYTRQRLAELQEKSDPQGEQSCDAAVQEWMKQRGMQTTSS